MDKIEKDSRCHSAETSASSSKHPKYNSKCNPVEASSLCKGDEDELVQRHRSKKRKRKRHRSSSSSSSSSSMDMREKRRKSVKKSSREKHHKAKRKSKKSHKRSKSDKSSKKKCDKIVAPKSPESDGEPIGPSPAKMCATIMKPMSKEDWEKQQSVLRHVYDAETGRTRLIKGDGEVMEEIVSFKQHQAINKVGTTIKLSID